MRVQKQRLNLLLPDHLGDIVKEKSNVKISIITSNESTQAFRTFLVKSGYKDDISTVTIPRERGQRFMTISLFGVPLKCHFVMWTSKKDTDTGRAPFWIGQPNPKKYVQTDMKHSLILNNRIVNKRVPWYGLIVTNRSVKDGMNIDAQNFAEYLLVPFDDIVEYLIETKQIYYVIKHPERKKYQFTTTIDNLKTFADTYDQKDALSNMSNK